MWLFSSYLMRKSAPAAITSHLSSKAKLSHYSFKERLLKTYSKVVNHLIETYAADDMIAETDREVAGFLQPPNMSPLQLVNDLWLQDSKVPTRLQQEYPQQRLRGRNTKVH